MQVADITKSNVDQSIQLYQEQKVFPNIIVESCPASDINNGLENDDFFEESQHSFIIESFLNTS